MDADTYCVDVNWDGICAQAYNCCLGNFGCVDMNACNYTEFSCPDADLCTYGGCNDPIACNFDPAAACDDGSCILPTLWYLPNEVGSGPIVLACEQPADYYLADQFCAQSVVDGDPYCVDSIWDEICAEAYNCCLGNVGCTDGAACNYTAFVCPDASLCIYPGCTDPIACNYDAEATCNDGVACLFPDGCTSETACNYDPLALCNDGSCNFDCICIGDFNGDGTLDTPDLLVILGAFNSSCGVPYCNGDVTGDGFVGTPDLLAFLGAFNTTCP